MITLNLENILDREVRISFQSLLDTLNLTPIVKGQGYMSDILVTGDRTDYKVFHGLKFTPTDAFITSIRGPAQVKFNYDKFDLSTISMDVTNNIGETSAIRFFIGKM